MLDDCKGDRFLEILLLFSTAVLKRTLIGKDLHDANNSIALRLVTANLSPKTSTEILVPLTIAYTKSITLQLRQKSKVQDTCRGFSAFLDDKTVELSERENSCRVNRSAPVPFEVSLKIEREVSQNWLGNARWPQRLLFGESTQDWALEQPFREVWHTAMKGESLQPTSESENLLQDLEKRVYQQKAMVRKWKDFHQNMVQRFKKYKQAQVVVTLQPEANSSFDFNQHKHLNLNSAVSQSTSTLPQSSAIDSIIAEMEAGLTRSYKPSAQDKVQSSYQSYSPFTTGPATHQHTLSRSSTETDTSTLNSRPNLNGNTRRISMSSTAVPLSRIFSPAKPVNLSNGSNSRRHVSSYSQDRASSGRLSSTSSGASTPVSDDNLSTPETKQDNIEIQANDIVSSIMNSTMTPIPEQKLSLAERTRLSMANVSLQPSPVKRPIQPSPEISTATIVIAAAPSIEDRRASLLERTQQSMSNLASNTKPGARKSLMVKKRQSVAFPVNQFETPGRPRPAPVRHATPTETLFSGEAEYASVFKSRPRLQTSPMPTPDMDDLPSPLGDLQEEDDDLDNSWLQSSPLRGKG
jgi:hypothetical protein